MKSTSMIIDSVVEYNKTHDKNEKITNAMNIIFNVVHMCTETHIEAMGLLECVKLELQEDFVKSSGDDGINLDRIILNKNFHS